MIWQAEFPIKKWQLKGLNFFLYAFSVELTKLMSSFKYIDGNVNFTRKQRINDFNDGNKFPYLLTYILAPVGCIEKQDLFARTTLALSNTYFS